MAKTQYVAFTLSGGTTFKFRLDERQTGHGFIKVTLSYMMLAIENKLNLYPLVID